MKKEMTNEEKKAIEGLKVEIDSLKVSIAGFERNTFIKGRNNNGRRYRRNTTRKIQKFEN